MRSALLILLCAGCASKVVPVSPVVEVPLPPLPPGATIARAVPAPIQSLTVLPPTELPVFWVDPDAHTFVISRSNHVATVDEPDTYSLPGEVIPWPATARRKIVLQLSPSGQHTVLAFPVSGVGVDLQTSTDLVNWTVVSTNSMNFSGPPDKMTFALYLHRNATENSPVRFYRLMPTTTNWVNLKAPTYPNPNLP